MPNSLNPSYKQWHTSVTKSAKPKSDLGLYTHSFLFGALTFALLYFYLLMLHIGNATNKALADTAVILIGLSMLLSSICYFWNFMDKAIVYRKHLGIVGFAFMIAHIVMSKNALLRLFSPQIWQTGNVNAPLTGLISAVIITLMAVVSNRYASTALGGVAWRRILRTGYIAIVFAWLHVFFLKWSGVMKWIQSGPSTLPQLNVLMLVFMLFVLAMRVALWVSLQKKTARR